MNTNRIMDELEAACGERPIGLLDGRPYWLQGKNVDDATADQVRQLHISNDQQYLRTDLTVHAAKLCAALGGASDPRWLAYAAVQDGLLKATRHDAYCGLNGPNELFMEMVSDGGTFTAARDAMKAAKLALKDLYKKS